MAGLHRVGSIHFANPYLAEFQRKRGDYFSHNSMKDLYWFLLDSFVGLRNCQFLQDIETSNFSLNITYTEGDVNLAMLECTLDALGAVASRLVVYLIQQADEDGIFTEHRIYQARYAAKYGGGVDDDLLDKAEEISNEIWTENGLDGRRFLPTFWRQFILSDEFWRSVLSSTGVSSGDDPNLSERSSFSSASEYSSHSQDLYSAEQVMKLLLDTSSESN